MTKVPNWYEIAGEIKDLHFFLKAQLDTVPDHNFLKD